MNTPICDFVNGYAKSKALRMHMPGHKGKSLLGMEALDITEIAGADVLYSARGIIKESEENASKLFGSGKTIYSAEGCTLAIRAMLYLATASSRATGQKPIILAGRNAHKTFISTCALLDFEVQWLYGEESDGIVSCKISPDCLDKALSGMHDKPCAVYVTSPDYLGNIADISGLSKVCKKHGVLLLVDNAHGAYLKFMPKDKHPITLGADICCDSAHKTLPVLTGGAYLHISKNAPGEIFDASESAMSLFASTSPSYIILQSLDAVNPYLERDFGYELSSFCEKLFDLKLRLKASGYSLCGDEELKISLKTKPYGYTGNEFADILYKEGIVCEFSDPDYLVLMLTPKNSDEELRYLEKVLINIGRKPKISTAPPPFAKCDRALSMREAIFATSKEVHAAESLGKVLANTNVSCPPAVPVAICGEVINREALALFEYYGTDTVYIVE